MNFYVAAGPNKGVTTQTGNINNLAGSATGSFVLMTKRTANQQANNNYDPLGWATINPSVVNNLNLAVVNKGIATTSSITAAGYSASSSALITTTSVTGGQTSVVNLTYGTGQLKQAVR